MAFCLSLCFERRDVQVRICSRPPVDGCYLTGEIKLASPRFASAQAHQMITLETFFTYPGRTISFWYLFAEQGFLLQFVQQIYLAVGVHNLPVRIRSVRHDEIF